MNVDYDRIAKIINFLHQNPSSPLEPDKIASKTGLSSNQFQQLFQDWAGISDRQFLHYLTPDYAIQKLIKPIKPVYSIENSSHQIQLIIHSIKNKRNNNTSDQKLKIHYGTISSPFGSAFIATIENKICHLSFID